MSGSSTAAVSSRIMSPSGKPMSAGPDNRTFVSRADPAFASQSDARVQASRENTMALTAQSDHRRHIAFRPIEQEWDHKNPCKYCGFIWLKSSSKDLRSKCCQNGLMADLDNCPFILGPLPGILDLGMCCGNPFARASNQYNHIFQMGAVGIENDKPRGGADHIIGNHMVRITGRTYHFIPRSNSQSGVQYFLHDGRQQELSDHGREQNVDDTLLQNLCTEFQANNRLCKLYNVIGRTAAHFVEGLGPDDPLDIPHTLIPMLNLATEEFDVSAVTLDRRTGNHVLTVREKFQAGVHSTAGGGRQSINSTSALFEPLSYPVLFPYGEPGWSMENRIGARGDAFKISFPNYLASRMLMPERYPNGNGAGDGDNYHGKMCIDKYGEEYFMPTNRFERFCRVGQTYLVDQMSRAIDQRLEYREKIKKSIFGEDTRERVIDDRSDDGHSDDEPDEIVAQAFGLNVAGGAAVGGGLGTFFDHGEDEVVRPSAFPPDFFLPPDPAVAAAAAPPLAPGRRPLDPKSKPTFLGDNFHGSPRHLKKLAINGLHLVTEHQNSHIFLTATVNKKWPELSEVIWDDMDPFDVPAIVGIVFQARLQALLHNLKNGK